jgi:hypothetical protein
VLISKLVSEHELCFEVLAFLTDRWMHKKLGHDFSYASRCKHPIASKVGARVSHIDFTVRPRFARPHNTGTVNVYRFLGHVGDLPCTDDLHRWLVADRCRTPSLVTHKRESSHGPNAECLPGDTWVVSCRPAPESAGPRPTTHPRKDGKKCRKKRADGGDGKIWGLNGAPIQHIFPHTHRLALAYTLANHTPLDAPPSTPEKNATAVWYQDGGGEEGGVTGVCKEKIGVLTLQGWRSVSVVCPPSGMVLYAASGAPDFLRTVTGRLLRQWDNIETLFERGKH